MVVEADEVSSGGSRVRTKPYALRAILSGGLLAGTLDIAYACIAWGLRGVSPVRVGQSVAAGLLGRKAVSVLGGK